MKRWMHSTTQTPVAASKKRKLTKEDYNAAIEVGRQILNELHTQYPEEYPRATPKSIKRSHSWSDHPYVLLDTGLRCDDIGPNYSEDIVPWKLAQRSILNGIIAELGYDPVEDFQAAIDCMGLDQKVRLVVYDCQQSAWEDH